MRILPSRSALYAFAALCLLVSQAQASDRSSASPVPPSREPAPPQVVIPGPLRSFLRMAGISQEVPPEDVLPTLARDVYVLGAPAKNATEYLVLLQAYVRQARELQALAAASGAIRVNRCEDAGSLLEVLGYHLRNACGQKDLSLATANPDRAFLTIDSGFPLTQLEEALQNNTPFTYPYPSTRVPVLLHPTDWLNLNTKSKASHADVLDLLLQDPQVARLYWAVSRIDPETARALQRSPGLVSLLQHADVLDFYGTQICIRSKRVLVPGGAAAEPAWKQLVGASPESPGEFVPRLLSQDQGWLATYFDTLARINQTQQEHFTQGQRLTRLYEAFHDPEPNQYAARAAFRKAPALLVLFTRQRWGADGEPVVPGDLSMWKLIVGRRARGWRRPEDLLEAMVSYSRLDPEGAALQIYLTLTELDGKRSADNRLSTGTMLQMASAYGKLSAWYPIFSEFQGLNDDSVTQFIHSAEALNHISNEPLRGDALGTFQANVGLWQILARQREIPEDQIASSWKKVLDPFEKVDSSAQLFDATQASLSALLMAATGKADLSQSELVDLLAGPPQKNSQAESVRMEVAARMRLVMDDQRLTPLDTLYDLNKGMSALSQHGTPASKELVAEASQLREFEMPRRIFSESEKAEWAPGVFSQRHVDMEMHTDLVKTLGQQGASAKIEASRGALTPFLRDTLVGLNYAYYEPPGSQIMHINPLFVRRHDFAAETVIGIDSVWAAADVFGAGAPAGGGAYLVGSLADLPYVLATAEQDFIAPANVQALIWQEIVPDLLAGSTLSRWWNVTPHELRAVALYQRTGEELLVASSSNPQLREKVVAILADRMSMLRIAHLEEAMQSGEIAGELGHLLPADTFYLAVEFRRRFPQEAASLGPADQALETLSRQYPAEVSLTRISADFGIPHLTLAQTYGRELLYVKPFPAFSGNFCRTFGESWDSTNLYWARLADEKGATPATLNLLSPQLTHLMISKIFASHFEDWPAVVRAMHVAGDEFLQGKVASIPGTETTAQR